MASGEGQERIEAYLRRLRQRLRGMNGDDAREIVAELRSHVVEKATVSGQLTPAAVDAALAALGSPEALAAEYLTDDLLARAEASRSPLRVLEGMFRWASLSVTGFFALLVSIVGYSLGAILMLGALLKPFHPQTAGLWAFRNSAGDLLYSLHLGFGSPPADGREVLGWWLIPIGLSLGGGLIISTTHLALWFAHRVRSARAWTIGAGR
jgi:HAAS domain-containing protein